MGDKILLVDDNPSILAAVEVTLSDEGFQVITAGDGQQALRAFYGERPALVILDIMMPKLDGWEVCRRIRAMSNIPIIIVTAVDAKKNVIQGLDLGADDYLVKPFDIEELLARVRAALRRARTEPEVTEETTYSDDYLSIDLDTRRVTRAGKLVQLTPTEYRLLDLLARNKGRPLAFRLILETVWGFEYIGETDYVRTYIWHLRRKLEPDPKNPRYLLSELDYGYRFEPQQ